MQLLGLFIKPLDDDEEAAEIIHILEQTGIGAAWRIERPSSETNAIIVCVVDEEGPAPARWEDREPRLQQGFARGVALLKVLPRSTIAEIERFGVDVFIRIHTDGSIFIPPDFAGECGRLGLEIRVYMWDHP